MIHTIRVAPLDEKEDVKGLAITALVKGNGIKKVSTARVYRLEGIEKANLKKIAEKLFSEKINQKYSIDKSIITGSSSKVEISYKPGVMNPEVTSILKAAENLKIKLKACDSSTEYHFFGNLKNGGAEKKVMDLKLFNPTVEYIVKKAPTTLIIKGRSGKTTIIPIRKMNDEKLMDLSDGKLFLNLDEMKVIKDYFTKIKRDPTDCELETIAQTWSEHCAHKTFKAKIIVDGIEKEPLIKRLIKESKKHDRLTVSSFVDNSGVMEFYDGTSICGKVETHNSPSAIEPYGGAATGSGGVFRDVLATGQGAKNIASTDIFCFASPDLSAKKLPEGCLPPAYLLKNVVRGVKDYGNRMGIPTNNGSVHFHDDFRAKPTVIVGAYGLIPTKKAKKGQAKVGDKVVVVGGRTGRDGIHGATFSSAEMTNKTQTINSSAVQIGNAIEEKRMFDAILEARDKNLIRAMQDCGAGGFSSAIGELGEGIGLTVDVSKAPLKYQGLAPWEIWISESQERLALAIAPENVKKFIKTCEKYNVEATVLGKFDGSKRIKVNYGSEKICDLESEFLFNGLPQRVMEAEKPKINNIKKKEVKLKNKKEWKKVVEKVLSSGNISSKEPIVRLYDHTVQGTNVLQPYSGKFLDGPMDAAVIRPLLDKNYGMVISHGLNPILVRKDPYWGSIWSAIEALSNYVSAGGDYREASLINNYIWPFPDKESLWSLDRSVDAVVDIMNIFKTPVISGKDSLSSTYRGKDRKVIRIPPVLCISVFGRIKKVEKTSTTDFKLNNSVICLVGEQDLKGMGGSAVFDVIKSDENQIPRPNLKTLPKVFTAINKGIKSGKILSCHDVSEGGMITSAFEMCVGGGIGAEIKIPAKIDALRALFNETPGCFIVEVESKKVAEELFKGVKYSIIGKTKEMNSLTVIQNGKELINEKVGNLKKVWLKPMQKLFA